MSVGSPGRAPQNAILSTQAAGWGLAERDLGGRTAGWGVREGDPVAENALSSIRKVDFFLQNAFWAQDLRMLPSPQERRAASSGVPPLLPMQGVSARASRGARNTVQLRLG